VSLRVGSIWWTASGSILASVLAQSYTPLYEEMGARGRTPALTI
jgi:hypothetical protein